MRNSFLQLRIFFTIFKNLFDPTWENIFGDSEKPIRFVKKEMIVQTNEQGYLKECVWYSKAQVSLILDFETYFVFHYIVIVLQRRAHCKSSTESVYQWISLSRLILGILSDLLVPLYGKSSTLWKQPMCESSNLPLLIQLSKYERPRNFFQLSKIFRKFKTFCVSFSTEWQNSTSWA